MSNVIDMTPRMIDRREQCLREKHGVDPEQSFVPLAYAVDCLLDRCKRQMAERRNRENNSR